MPTHPKFIIKYVHKSVRNAVKIVSWDDHHEIATVPDVYTYQGERSEGAQAADLFAAAPEMLELLEKLLVMYDTKSMTPISEYSLTWNAVRDTIQKAKGE